MKYRGRVKEAIREYELTMEIYKEINILPLPGGPVELYKIGVWYANKDPVRAIKFLEWYLDGRNCEGGLTFERSAEILLEDLKFEQMVRKLSG